MKQKKKASKKPRKKVTTEIYDPREDSILLAEQVRKHAFGKVLDFGAGSGIQAVEASAKTDVESVLAVDINKNAVEKFAKIIKDEKLVKIKTRVSDMFSKIKKGEEFDTIIFNPPYLPEDPNMKVKDIALEGGKKGYESIEKFLKKAKKHLAKKGIILMIFSSLTKKRKVSEIIKKSKFKFEELSSQRIFFEDLYVYKIFR